MHIFLPFFGGPDDRLALEFVVGLCRRNERLRATVVRLQKVEAGVAAGATTGAGGTIPGAEGRDKVKIQGDRNEEVNMITVASVSCSFRIFVMVTDAWLCRISRDSRIQCMATWERKFECNQTGG